MPRNVFKITFRIFKKVTYYVQYKSPLCSHKKKRNKTELTHGSTSLWFLGRVEEFHDEIERLKRVGLKRMDLFSLGSLLCREAQQWEIKEHK